MDNPTRWNITNSAQNIVSALVDPSKQFDHVFRREWSNTFSGFSRHKPSMRGKQDAELKSKLAEYVRKLEDRKFIKKYEAQREAAQEDAASRDKQNALVVPDVFMMEDFDLSNLEVFNKVINATASDNRKKKFLKFDSTKDNKGDDDDDELGKESDNYDLHSTSSSSSSNTSFTKSQLKQLQQDFTDYLDMIEEKLASQISNRSGDFFQVMSSVDSVMDELSLAIKSVTSLRRKCFTLNNALILPNMKNIHLSKTRNNAQIALDKMKEISNLCKVQPMIQLLLSTSDFVGALDLISDSRVKLHKELTRVVCLKHLESQLVEIEGVIGTMVQQEFVTLITSEWSRPLSNRLLQGRLLPLLQTQADKFVNKFHEERKKRIESNLDIEQWKMVEEVPQDFQRLVSLLVDEDVSISDTFTLDHNHSSQQHSAPNSKQHSRTSSDVATLAADQSEQHQQANGSKQITGAIIASSSEQQPPQPPPPLAISSSGLNQKHLNRFNVGGIPANGCRLSYVSAGGSAYVIVNSVINLIRTAMDYCKCAYDIRSLSAELLERLFKILQLYNSKTYHLVYSAGAIQVAGLKTITTRSLIVSQRSLKLIILLIPAIYKHFSQLLPANDRNRLRRFNEIKLSYEDHAAKIPERVNSIVKDVINLQLQEWEAKPPVPSAQFTAVAQHLTRLHDNIQDALPPDELRLLFVKISQTFKSVLIMHLRRLDISNDAGPQQWLVTQELTFYKISLAKLSVFKGWELDYDDLWAKLNSELDSNNSGSGGGSSSDD